MPSPKPLSLILATAVLLAACSKKEQTAATTPAAPPAAPATAPAAEPDKDAPSIRFNLPGASDTGGTAAPSRAPSTPSLPSVAPTSPSPADQDGMEFPQIVEFYPPFYPLSLRVQGIEGRVVLALDINERGDVTKAAVYASSASQFNESAIAAAKQWKFNPARKNGQPIAGNFIFPALDFVSEFGSGQMSNESPLAPLTYVDGMFYSTSKEGRLAPANSAVSPLLRVSPSIDPRKVGGKELNVTVVATVNEEGQVTDATIKDASGTEFDQLAVKAVRFWQFVPAIKNGKPYTTKASLPIKLPAAKAPSN